MPEQALSTNEEEFLSVYNPDYLKSCKLSINDISAVEVSVDFYAFDKEAKSFFDLLVKANKQIFYDGSILDENRMTTIMNAASKVRDKTTFYKMISSSGVSCVPDRHIFVGSVRELRNGKSHIIDSVSFPLIIKSKSGKGGKGNLVCRDDKDFDKAIQIVSGERFVGKSEYQEDENGLSFIIEPFLDGARSFNFSMKVKTSTEQGYVSEQLIEEVFYRGNRSIDNKEREKSDLIARSSADVSSSILLPSGYEGWVGIDYIEHNGILYAIEVNPRVNNVTHAAMLASQRNFMLKLFRYCGMSSFSGKLVYDILSQGKNTNC